MYLQVCMPFTLQINVLTMYVFIWLYLRSNMSSFLQFILYLYRYNMPPTYVPKSRTPTRVPHSPCLTHSYTLQWLYINTS